MSFENNCVKNICRVCLEQCNKLYPLLGTIPNVDEDISSMVKYCTSIEVIIEEDLPEGVCRPCFKTIRIAYNFIKQFKDSNRRLLENRKMLRIEHLYEYKQDVEIKDESAEEVIIEYTTDLDSNAILNTEDINIVEVNYEDQRDQESHVYDYVCENNVTLKTPSTDIAKGHEDEENISIAADKVQDEPLEELTESKLLLRRKLGQSFTCPICRRTFTKFEVGFVKHLSAHEEVKLKCDKCSLDTTLTVDLYIQHFRKAHRFQCDICSRSYGRRSGLYYHIKTHNDRKIYKCSYKDCGKSFLTGWCLRKHYHTHSESAKYVCSKCGVEFKTYGTYKYHQKTHDGNRSFLCTECGQTFLQLIHLKYHMWKHTGIKMFQCDKCHKSYTSQTQLKKHKKRKTCGILIKTKRAI